MKLSELLEVAIPHFKAYDKLVQKGTHKWTMCVWLYNNNDGKCEACLAGAVLYGMGLELLGMSPGMSELDQQQALWMEKIDNVRVGEISAAHVVTHNDYGQKRPPRAWQYSAIDEMNTFIRDNFDHSLERAPFEIYEHVAQQLKEVGL